MGFNVEPMQAVRIVWCKGSDPDPDHCMLTDTHEGRLAHREVWRCCLVVVQVRDPEPKGFASGLMTR